MGLAGPSSQQVLLMKYRQHVPIPRGNLRSHGEDPAQLSGIVPGLKSCLPAPHQLLWFPNSLLGRNLASSSVLTPPFPWQAWK